MNEKPWKDIAKAGFYIGGPSLLLGIILSIIQPYLHFWSHPYIFSFVGAIYLMGSFFISHELYLTRKRNQRAEARAKLNGVRYCPTCGTDLIFED